MANWLGSKVGRATSARISPVCGSRAIAAPFLPSIAFSAAIWTSRSMVIFRSFAGLGHGLAQVADLLAVRVDDDVSAAVDTTEQRIVGGFDTGLSDHIAGIVEGILLFIQVLFGDLADVPDEMGRKAAARVDSSSALREFQLRQLVPVSFNEGLLVRGDVLLQRDGAGT